MKRNVVDIVVISLTTLVGLLLVLSTIGIVLSKIIHPEADVKAGAEVIGNTITTIVGALVGFIGGRAQGRSEANGIK